MEGPTLRHAQAPLPQQEEEEEEEEVEEEVEEEEEVEAEEETLEEHPSNPPIKETLESKERYPTSTRKKITMRYCFAVKKGRNVAINCWALQFLGHCDVVCNNLPMTQPNGVVQHCNVYKSVAMSQQVTL